MYVPTHQELGNHPKLRRLARTLAISRPAAVGHLLYLWWWSQDYAPDGDLSYDRYSAEDIADAAMWDADAYAFVDALKSSGFLDDVDGRLVIHDWEDYGGKVVREQAADRERKRRKALERKSADVPVDAESVPQSSTGNPPEIHRSSDRRLDKKRKEEIREERPRGREDAPSSNRPFGIVAAMCRENGTDVSTLTPATKDKQAGVASALLGKGYADRDIIACFKYLRSQQWRDSPVDLTSVASEIAKWETDGKPARASPNGRGGANGKAAHIDVATGPVVTGRLAHATAERAAEVERQIANGTWNGG